MSGAAAEAPPLLLLLDTNAVLYLAFERPMAEVARAAADAAAASGGLLVSTVSAWEVGLLVAKRRLVLELEPLAWFEAFLSRPGVRLAPLTVRAALLSSFLPEPFHGDPADRMLVAAARELGASLVTRDTRILAYAAAGHLRALPC